MGGNTRADLGCTEAALWKCWAGGALRQHRGGRGLHASEGVEWPEGTARAEMDCNAAVTNA